MATRSITLVRTTWARLVQASASLARVWRRRRELGRLAALDDHLLADIGITRQDVTSVLAESLFVDATEKLAERARETRSGRRAAAREARLAEAPVQPPRRRAA